MSEAKPTPLNYERVVTRKSGWTVTRLVIAVVATIVPFATLAAFIYFWLRLLGP